MLRALALAVLLAALPAWADEVGRVQQALDAGDYAQALAEADRALATQPKNARLRFARALTLARMGRREQAISAFSDLAREFPQRPEPHNNLAALYVQGGQLEKARDALEAAVRADPNFPAAQENLGDLYAQLANAAYEQALKSGKASPTLRYKRDLQGQVCAVPEEGVLQSPVSVAPAVPPASPALLALPPASPAPALAMPAKAEPPAASNSETESPETTLERWRAAWERGDLDAYLKHYSMHFQPSGGLTRSAWQAQRRLRVPAAAGRRIEWRGLQVSPADEGLVEVNFEQAYTTPYYINRVNKRLLLRKAHSGAWMILREEVLQVLENGPALSNAQAPSS